MFNCVVGERGALVSPPRSCEGQCLWWKTQGMHCSRGLVLDVLVWVWGRHHRLGIHRHGWLTSERGQSLWRMVKGKWEGRGIRHLLGNEG